MTASSSDRSASGASLHAASDVLDVRTLSKLRWRCRRGLLENDLLIERFFEQYESTLTYADAAAMDGLMDLSDNDLLDLLLHRSEPDALLDNDAVRSVLTRMRVGSRG